MNIYSSFTPICQSLEASKMSFSVIHSDSAVLFSAKKKVSSQVVKRHRGTFNVH